MKISLEKKYKTRGGEDVVLYCVDAPGVFCVHGRIGDNMASWTLSGRNRMEEINNYDLIEVEEEHSLWVNVCKKDGLLFPASTSFQGRHMLYPCENHLYARIQIKFKRGDGLTEKEKENLK